DVAYVQTQLLIAQKEETGIQLQAKEFDLMATAVDLDEIEEVNTNCILMANLQQASTSGTQTDKAPVHDSDGSAEEAAKFFGDFKSFAKEADESLAKHKALELEIERLLRAFYDECKYDKISYDKAYKDMQQKIERLQAQLGDLKGKGQDTSCVSDTLNPLSQKLENENVELEFQDNKSGTSANTKFAKQSIVENLPNVGFGDLQWGNILITRVYFVEGLGHNLFSVGQFCDSDLEVAFRRNACFVRNLEGVDLLKRDRLTNLYTINLDEMASASPICLMARTSSTKSWLWHQRLSHLNFDTINELARNDLVSGLPKFKYNKEHLCPSCEQGKSKRASHPPKPVPNLRQRLHLLHMDLCGPIRIASINRKRTDNGTKFKNQVLKEYFDSIGISHQMSSVRTPQQNGVVERKNQTLVEAAKTMLIFSRAPLFLWAEAIATACFTQNRSIIHRYFNKMPYELINGRKLDISFLYVFGALCYPKNDREDFGKLGAKGDIGFFIGYSADSCAYRVSGLDLTYASLTITMQQPSEGDMYLLFEAMYDDYIGGQPSTTARTVPAAQEPQVRQTSTVSTTIADTAPTPTNSSSQATIFPNSSHDVDEFNSQQQHAQQQGNQAHLQSTTVADNVPNALFDGNTFNVKEAMTDPTWIDSMQEELLQLKRLDVWVLVPAP
nr:Gag-Pol polyprotein [Tanacetum cinerariifolium]